jgi:Domain of unknown function (DUF397)
MADVPEGKPIVWHKSSYSSDTANCVEVALESSDRVGLRDSEDPDGPSLWFAVDSWRDFIADVAAGELDPPGPQAGQS